jgi:predicted CoA-binding protein
MDFFSKQNSIAVIGFSRDKSKYGYRVFMRLRELGFSVYAVNPNMAEFEGTKVYPDSKSVPKKMDVAIMVVKPEIGIGLLDNIAKAGVKGIWFQPGSESAESEKRCKELGLSCVIKKCFIVDGLKTDFGVWQ